MLARMSLRARRLVPGDEAMLESFLAGTPETTLFLRSNLARVGLADDGAPFTGTYAGAFDGDELAGVAAIFWNDNILLAPGPHAELCAKLAVELSGRRPLGILGPNAEVIRVRAALGLSEIASHYSSTEILYVLDTNELVVPPAVSSGEVVVRHPEDRELDALLDWRMQYCAETMNMADTPSARSEQALSLAGYQKRRHHFVVVAGRELVAYSAFNATLPDIVQIGGVWTPPELRGHGYARCAVAGSLLEARARGVRRSVLFTGETNAAAQRAYVAIGFRPIGDYGIVMFGR